MARGGMPVKQVAEHALGRPPLLKRRYPCYGLLPGGRGEGREHRSLIFKEFGLPVTGVTSVTS